LSNIYTIKIHGDEYEVLAEAGEYDYSWSEVALLRKDGQLYYGEGSGCSCTSFAYEADPVPVASWQEAVEKAKVFFNGEYSLLDTQYAVDFAEACLKAFQ
jgi:hypothetical protein